MASQVGGRESDPNGLPLMLGDSSTAAVNFGLTGGSFTSVPKNKFLFYVKFFRPDTAGGPNWGEGLGTMVKNIDRPRISFKTQTLNQYNRKRIVQTSHEFESLQLKFHDTVGEEVQRMFIEYYQYYYGDTKINGSGSSVYDVVRGEADRLGQWGFLPPLSEQNNGYFFSHISVYQMYNGLYTQFDLINPKLTTYNPDDFDYSVGALTNEIQIAVDFEGIVYHDSQELTDEMAESFGLSRGRYWDVPDLPTGDQAPGLSLPNNGQGGDFVDAVGGVLGRNLASLVTGQGGQSTSEILGSLSGAFDANRGLAVGKTGLRSIKDLVSGKTQSGKQGAQGLLKGVLYGKPGSII
jgi:hypothetical protein